MIFAHRATARPWRPRHASSRRRARRCASCSSTTIRCCSKSLRDALETDGHEVTSANGGQAGIDAFVESHAEGRPFPVVITDLGMPHVDGRKVASTIKASAPETLVIMLTGWGRRLVAEGDVPPGVDQVLSKPPKLIELRAALAPRRESGNRTRIIITRTSGASLDVFPISRRGSRSLMTVARDVCAAAADQHVEIRAEVRLLHVIHVQLVPAARWRSAPASSRRDAARARRR